MPDDMPLRFLEFDLIEDPEGLRTWSALAAPRAAQASDLLSEVQALINDLTGHLGDPGPVDDDHLWDMALDIEDQAGRTTVSLHLSGGDALAERLARWIHT